MRVVTLLCALAIAGCCGPDLRPTVRLLRATVLAVKVDYAEGRVELHEHALDARLDRLEQAALLAETALEDE